MIIVLTDNKYTVIDEEDFEKVSKYTWYACLCYESWYVRNTDGGQFLHQFLMSAPPGWQVDHINHDTMDNRRGNLRVVTPSENGMNKRKANGTFSSQYKGVSWHKGAGKWIVEVRFEGTRHYVGLFTDEHEAAEAYNVKAVEVAGDFVHLNTINRTDDE